MMGAILPRFHFTIRRGPRRRDPRLPHPFGATDVAFRKTLLAPLVQRLGPMSARAIWAELEATGFATAARWVESQRAEDITLEFKEASPRDGLPSNSDRTKVGKAMSAFANVEGGVLVFGIKVDGRSALPDAASGVSPVTEAARFAAKLSELVRDLTVPPMPGVRVRAFTQPNETDGIVAVYVPHADNGPFRAAGNKGFDDDVKDRYFMRTTRGTDPMPHQLLGAMFGRVPSPRLHLRITVLGRSSQPAPPNGCALSLDVVNLGRGGATAPSVRLRLYSKPLGRVLYTTGYGWADRHATPTPAGQGVNDGFSRRVSSAHVYSEDALQFGGTDTIFGEHEVSVRLDAEGAAPTQGSETIDVSALGQVFWIPRRETDDV